MGKPTGFLEYERQENVAIEPLSRITNFNEFHPFLDEETRRKAGCALHELWRSLLSVGHQIKKYGDRLSFTQLDSGME